MQSTHFSFFGDVVVSVFAFLVLGLGWLSAVYELTLNLLVLFFYSLSHSFPFSLQTHTHTHMR